MQLKGQFDLGRNYTGLSFAQGLNAPSSYKGKLFLHNGLPEFECPDDSQSKPPAQPIPDAASNAPEVDLFCTCQKPWSEDDGEMVGCDGGACRYNWFHLSCVGLNKLPETDTWLCPDCAAPPPPPPFPPPPLPPTSTSSSSASSSSSSSSSSLSTSSANTSTSTNITPPPIMYGAIVVADQHHAKVALGHNGKFERLVAVDKNNVPTLPEDGGAFPPEKPATTMKYTPEVRGHFVVAQVKQEDGTTVGRKGKIFWYNGALVVGVRTYQQIRRQEYERVKQLKGVWGAQGKGYKERFGDKWLEELDKTISTRSKGRTVCVTQLMKFTIDETERLFADSPLKDYVMIFHDALSAWNEKGAQDYLLLRGWAHRFFRCINPTNEGTRYEGTLTGNRAAMCRGLDAFGFSHLEYQVTRHASMTSVYHGTSNEHLQFKTGTPDELVRTIERIWTDVAPTPEQINDDISGYDRVLDSIIEAKGTMVADADIRRGGRREALSGTRTDKSKAQQVRAPKRRRQSKDTLKDAKLAIHPDAEAAWDAVKAVGDAAVSEL